MISNHIVGYSLLAEERITVPSSGALRQHLTGDVLITRDGSRLGIYLKDKPTRSGEGLPPVGVRCEYNVGGGDWFFCTIRYVTTPYPECPVEVVIYPPHLKGEQTGVVGTGPGEVSFRPIRTPEQIADDERAKAAIGMSLCIGGINSLREQEIINALALAGYRKQADHE